MTSITLENPVVSKSASRKVTLSSLQERICLLEQKDFKFYVQAVLKIDGFFNKENLLIWLKELVAGHNILRTSFEINSNKMLPTPSVHNKAEVNIEFIDLIGKNDPECIETITEIIAPHSSFISALIKQSEDKHLLVLRIPAVMADGHSLLNIIQNLSKGIRESKAEKKDILQYEQFVTWQNQLIKNPDEEAEYFWKNYDFSGYKTLKLPFEASIKSNEAYNPQIFSLSLTEKETASLIALAEDAGVSPSDILQSVLSCLVYKHTGTNNAAIGKVIVDREYEDLKETIGLISKTVPVVKEFDAQDYFIEYAKKLSTEIEDVCGWEQYFLLAEETQGDIKEPVILPLGFEYFDCAEALESASSLNVSLVDFKSFTDQFKLKISCLKKVNNLQIDFCFDTQYFSFSSIKVLAEQYRQIINTVVKAPKSAIKDILPVSSEESFLIQNSFNTPVAENITALSIVEMFESHAAQTPDQVAVVSNDKTYTYGELNKISNQLARHLKAQYNVGPGNIVGLMVERSPRMIIGILSILKAGASFLPLDPNTPKDRRSYTLTDAKVNLLLTDSSLMFEVMEYYSGDLFALDLQLSDLVENEENLDNSPSSANSAYVIYTSGSTGKPKGVVVNHSSLTNYVEWFKSTFNIGPTDRTLLFSSVAFDLCYTSLWSSLASGSSLYLLKESNPIDPQELTRSLIKNKITYIKLTPSHFNIIVNTDFEELIGAYNLRLVVIGGEEIRVTDLEKYYQYRKDIQFVNHYGPTETTIGCIFKPIKFEHIARFKSRPVIGKPIRNTRIYILNEANEIVPVGVVGEICVSGLGLSAGYLNNKELTDTKFITNPYETGKRLYRTGDLGRWTADGEIEFLGRGDNQVKIRGYRIELGEIENVLRQHALVLNSAVIVREDKSGDKELVGYVESKQKIVIKELQKHLRAQLPEYMIPAHILVLNELPLTANGKVNRKTLPLPETFSDEANGNYVAPGNSVEEKLAEIWQEVLGKERIGIRDNFFQIGGHSLKAVQIISRIHKELQSKVELKDIFDTPTIAELSAIIKGSKGNTYETIKPLEKQDCYELSHAQQQLWFVDKLQDNQSAYNRPMTYLFEELNRPAFEKALETLIRRHEMLRTIFVTIDGGPKQVVEDYNHSRFGIEYIDIRGEENPEEKANQIINDHAQHRFDLSKGPLVKSVLIQKDENTCLFSLILHHILCDGWSIEILKKEIIALYDAYNKGQENPLAPLKIQYKDFAHWHNSLDFEKEQNYWLDKLAGKLEMVNLPYDKIRSDSRQFKGEGISFEVDKENTASLKELAEANNTTLSNAVLSVFLLFLNKITGQKDILLGIGHANRNDVDLENLIGLFVNTVVIRTRFEEDMSFDQLLQQVANNCLEAYDNRNYPYDLLIEKLKIARDSNYLPLLNVVYIYKNYENLTNNLDTLVKNGEDAMSSESVNGMINHSSSKTDLILYVSEFEETLIVGMEYDSDLFLPDTMEGMANILNSLFSLITSSVTSQEN